MYVQIAWRNIWRNPRRTTVILIAIVMGVWCMIFLGALMRGMMLNMIDNGISTLTGDVQIHQKGYREDPVVENSMREPGVVYNVLESLLPRHARWAGRIRVNAIASNARHHRGITLVGIEPLKEPGVSFMGPSSIVKGRYLGHDDRRGAVVGQALLDKFETKLGRKLVIMSQDSNKDIASRAFRIIGVFKAEMQATEEQFVFVTLPAAQKMLKLGKAVSEISIGIRNHDKAEALTRKIGKALPPMYDVASWQVLLPLLEAYLRLFNGFNVIWYFVVFIAMGFGIVNTTLMAVFERIREFGLLKALGMKPWWIIRGVLTESLWLILIGTAMGNILGLLSAWALARHGIDLSALAAGTEFVGMSRVIYPAIRLEDMLMANLVVFVLGLLISVYPAFKAAGFTPVEALVHT